MQFLWGGEARPGPQALVLRGDCWWQQYSKSLRLSAAAKKELHESCLGLVSVLPDPREWSPKKQPFRGLVVGAVQSGKTGSMIGLAALALDQGYRIVVVLSGNKDDLRRQTAKRFNSQLLRRSELISGSGGNRTLTESEASGALPSFCLPYDRDAHQYAAFHNLFQAALEKGHPAVIIVKKHTASLLDVRRKLEIAYQRLGVDALPTLVLDDECDEASVDRDDVLVPSAIAGLWRRDGDHPHVAYIGYTATSAANLLQHRDNELFPSDFVSLLRYPAGESTALSFFESSPHLWYTGGFDFYESFGDEPGPNDNFVGRAEVDARQLLGPVQANSSVLSAVRAYVVSGAMRMALRPCDFDDPDLLPDPHSMLVQTSASKTDHRSWLEAIVSLFDGVRSQAGTEWRWSPDVVMQDVYANEGAWRLIYDDFVRSRSRVLEERPRVHNGGLVTWSQVISCIPAFVAEVKIKVVNSDEAVGADLDFAPRFGVDGSKVRPQDLFVVVIGGARLSRGITIEGLCVTYFARWNPAPTEDTVLQLSRWYGYRGAHLEFCRLFTTPEIFSQLREMDANDRDLRERLAALMREQKSPSDAAIVIGANPRALPTGKLGEGTVHDLSFSPFATVFRHVEIDEEELQRSNQEFALRWVEAVRSRGAERVVAASGTARGFVSRDWSAVEVADVLDGLKYADHNPSALANPAPEYYRRPDGDRPILLGRTLLTDPYQVAAYLRQWAANGEPPAFNAGIAFGEMVADLQPFDFPLVNREIAPDSTVIGGWTGRRAGWQGDQLFDDPAGTYAVSGTMERRPGACGLLLMYVIHQNAIGKHGRGKLRRFHTPMFGVVIPGGGPTWRRVTVDRRGVVNG